MRGSRVRRRARLLRALPFAAAAVLFAGAAYAGDFGRPRPFIPFGDFVSPPRDDIVTSALLLPSPFPFNDEERELRALAENLLAHPFERFWRHGLPIAGLAYTAEDYAAFLLNEFASAAARYARLIDDTRNDIVRTEPFFATARWVADLDRKRELSLRHVTAIAPEEVGATHARVRENMLLIAEVHRTVAVRAGMYRFALERLVLAVPSPLAAEAERARLELERRLAAIEVIGPPARRVVK
jgi:hypothetical protein